MLKRKGLGKLIHDWAPDCTKKFATDWVAGTATMEQFDALIVAILEINLKAHTMTGLAHEDPRCALCAVEFSFDDGAGASWIDNVTDLMLLTAKVNHLV